MPAHSPPENPLSGTLLSPLNQGRGRERGERGERKEKREGRKKRGKERKEGRREAEKKNRQTPIIVGTERAVTKTLLLWSCVL